MEGESDFDAEQLDEGFIDETISSVEVVYSLNDGNQGNIFYFTSLTCVKIIHEHFTSNQAKKAAAAAV